MKRKAFTLIELSIVLVIIGLIVGGILVGKDLIKAAEIRKTVSQKEKFDTAANTFKLKFNCLPGDCANADQFGLGSGSTSVVSGNGNGDGLVCVPAADGWATECINFWSQLYSSKLLSDESWPTTTTPDAAICFFPGFHSPKPLIGKQYNQGALGCGSSTSPLRGGWGVWDAQAEPRIAEGRTGQVFSPLPSFSRVYMILANTNFGGSHQGILTPNEMRMVDGKIDDGNAFSGSVFVVFTEMRTNDGAAKTFSKPDSVWNSGYFSSDDIAGTANLVIRAGF